MAQSLYEMVAELLRSNPKKYLTAREIAEWIIENKLKSKKDFLLT